MRIISSQLLMLMGCLKFLHELSIPASNEPSGHACTASWRMPRGSNTFPIPRVPRGIRLKLVYMHSRYCLYYTPFDLVCTINFRKTARRQLHFWSTMCYIILQAGSKGYEARGRSDCRRADESAGRKRKFYLTAGACFAFMHLIQASSK